MFNINWKFGQENADYTVIAKLVIVPVSFWAQIN